MEFAFLLLDVALCGNLNWQLGSTSTPDHNHAPTTIPIFVSLIFQFIVQPVVTLFSSSPSPKDGPHSHFEKSPPTQIELTQDQLELKTPIKEVDYYNHVAKGKTRTRTRLFGINECSREFDC